MNLKRLARAAAAGTTLFVAAPALAHPPQWAPAHGWQQHHRHRHFHHQPRHFMIAPPAPVYYYAPPRPQVVPPGRVFHRHVPANPGLHIGFHARYHL